MPDNRTDGQKGQATGPLLRSETNTHVKPEQRSLASLPTALDKENEQKDNRGMLGNEDRGDEDFLPDHYSVRSLLVQKGDRGVVGGC